MAQLSSNARMGLSLLVAAIIAAWINSLTCAFQFDDYHVIVDNPAVHGWGACLHSMPGIRPLLKLSYSLNWMVSPNPWGFRLVNLLCHLGSSALVFLLLRRLLREEGEESTIAVVAALLFALHPAQTEVVTYVSGRSVGLMSLCYLSAFAAHVRAEEGGRRWEWLSLLLFVMAMAVKETAVTLPFALLLWEQTRRREPLMRSVQRVWPHFLVLGIGAVTVLLHARYRHLLAVSLDTRSPLENLAAQVHGIFYLIGHPLLTLRTNADPMIDTQWPWYITAIKAGALFAAVALGFHQLRTRPWLGFGLLWFFLHLLPTNSFIARLDLANDRQLYLPLLGPALIAAVLLHHLFSSRVRLAAALALTLTLAGATALRNRDYRDELTFWQTTTQSSPDKARPWNNVGYAWQQLGNQEAARAAYQRALNLDPTYWRARVNLMVLDQE